MYKGDNILVRIKVPQPPGNVQYKTALKNNYKIFATFPKAC